MKFLYTEATPYFVYKKLQTSGISILSLHMLNSSQTETIMYFHYRSDSFILLCRCFALSLLSAKAKILTMQSLARYHISFYSFLHHGNTGSCLTFASMTTHSYNAVSNKYHYTTHSASRMSHKSPATFQ